MFNGKLFNFKIDCALPFSWNKGKAFAYGRNFDALSFRVKGNANYFHREKTYHVETNDILFVPAHYDYTIDSNATEEVLVIHFYMENSEFKDMKIFTPANPEVFHQLFSKTCKLWKNKSAGYRYELPSVFYEILKEMEVQKQNNSSLQPIFQNALDYMQKNFNDPEITIESIAKYIKVSTVYLRKLFKLNMNISPIKYLNTLKLERANELLKAGYYSIEQISSMSGFNDSKYFSTLYKKNNGISPSKNLKRALK